MMTASEPILSVEAAIAALKGDDQQLSYHAAWWLGKHQVQESCPHLCEALQDEKYRTVQGGYPLRRQAARTLGILKNPLAVPDLLEQLEDQGDPQLQEAVIQALATIGDIRAISPLVKLLKTGGELPYEALIEALGSFKVTEVQNIIELFQDHPSERVQCAAARYFYQITEENRYLERIIRNLDHENPYLRWAAAFDLGAIGHLQAAEAIKNASLGNSLKLLNLKRIIESVLNSDATEVDKKDACKILFKTIDDLLIEL
jgi:phycoerythrocyanin alpha-cysteine-84 phycoviolobilin lyase/isomerase subunit PecE